MSEVSYLRQKEKPPPFSYLLADQEPINTVFGNVPLRSCLSYQLQDFGRPKIKFITNFQANANRNVENLTCNVFSDISMIDPKIELFDIKKFIPNNDFYISAKEYFADNVITDLTSATDLEKRTVLEGKCSEWLLERQY